MGLYLAPTVISGLAYSRCSINVSSKNVVPVSSVSSGPWFLNGPLQKVDSGPSHLQPLSGHVSLCLNHRRPNSLSSSSCSPNEILAAGPLYKTDKQEGNLAEVGEENRVPILLGLPVPSVAPRAPAEIPSFCLAILVPSLVTDSDFLLWTHPHSLSDRNSMHPTLPVSQCHSLFAVTGLGKTRDLGWSRV